MATRNLPARVLTFAVSGTLLLAGCDDAKSEAPKEQETPKGDDGPTVNPGPEELADDGAVAPPGDEGTVEPVADTGPVEAEDAGEQPPIKTNPGPAPEPEESPKPDLNERTNVAKEIHDDPPPPG